MVSLAGIDNVLAVMRYVTSDRATIFITGNTLGLASAVNQNGPGLAGSTHTFISDTLLVDNIPPNPGNPWPQGTTNDWTQNGSSAQLALPVDSDVLHAELIWGGSFDYGGEDVLANLDDPVTLTTPIGMSTVSPAIETAATISIFTGVFQANYYLRTADVTDEVSTGGPGSYTIGGVPGTQNEMINSLNAAGWSLVVIVRDELLGCSSIQFETLGIFVDETASAEVTTVNLATPNTGEVLGRVLTGAIEGDADVLGDSVQISAPGSPMTFIDLAGTRNPADNFFASQINDRDGNLDTTGTFGNLNHDPGPGINVVGARQGWDHTGIVIGTIDGTLANNQEQSLIRWVSSGDSYIATFAAIEVMARVSECDVVFRDGFEFQARL